MDNKQFGKELEKRTRVFAVMIIRLSTKLPNTPGGRVVSWQEVKPEYEECSELLAIFTSISGKSGRA